IIVVFSEGMPQKNGKKYSEYFAEKVQEITGVETKFARVGHIIRGGGPTLRDRMTATQMGVEAVNLLLQGKSNRVMCVLENKITNEDINYALVLDRMCKGKLKDGDLDRFSADEIASMRARCAYRQAKIEKLYNMAYEICN
ncbi:MAG: 6-phosphofructokinase, partial [Clostridia bacterium]|nr:6-phosphofructokinase [Clostridia bacterium]